MDRSCDFLGEEVGSDAGEVLVIAVPVELTTSYIEGTSSAPEAMIEASRQIELYNPLVDIDLEGSGIHTVRSGARDRDALLRFISENREELDRRFCVFLGGEHSITPWILRGMDYGEIGIVWLDAHADLRAEYLGDRESHACAARNSLAYGPMVEIGVRSFSKEEHDFISSGGGPAVFRSWGEAAARAVDGLPERVYLSLDFDAFDPSELRALGTPEPGGLRWGDLIDMLDHVFGGKMVVGMDAVELCPGEHDRASDFIAAKAVYEAVSRYLARKESR